VQIGGFDSTLVDFEIPRKYGLNFTIADTTGPGGLFRALRTFPMLSGLARDMDDVCPKAILLNYSNPMSMNMQTITRTSDVRAVGLCHSVQGTTRMHAAQIGADYADVAFKCYGINHQAWITEFRVKGKDAYPEIKKVMFKKFPSPEEGKPHGTVASSKEAALAVDHGEKVYHYERVRTEIMRTFGYFHTESSHHAGEYLPWFRKNKETIDSYIKTRWDYYELMSNYDFKKQVEMVKRKCREPLQCSLEYGARIIHAMETHDPIVIYGNVPNYGAPGASLPDGAHLIPNLPQNACVEVACLVDRNGIQPTAPGPLPPQLAAINRTNINVQELAVLAHRTGDPALIEQAVALDPLTGALLTLPQIRSLVREMLKAQRRWLPQFKAAAR
jgi:alpha-galactosidase